jgi:hypothetical protein
MIVLTNMSEALSIWSIVIAGISLFVAGLALWHTIKIHKKKIKLIKKTFKSGKLNIISTHDDKPYQYRNQDRYYLVITIINNSMFPITIFNIKQKHNDLLEYFFDHFAETVYVEPFALIDVTVKGYVPLKRKKIKLMFYTSRGKKRFRLRKHGECR